MNIHQKVSRMILAALFLALSYVLPFLTGQIPKIGATLCPMHLPVLLCGFVCGPSWGLVIGAIAPLLRSLTLGTPYFYPKAVCMAFELAGYGALSGLMYRILPPKKLRIYCALFVAMLGGRLVWGIAMSVCMRLTGNRLGLVTFLTTAFVNSLPGIIIQAVLVPLIVMALSETSLLTTRK